jgi:hypothetical protein
MMPLSSAPAAELTAVRYLLTDIDDTLTREGKLLPEAFTALWRLSEAGLRVIPVTGRPAGWCDLIIRQWPVDAVVGENGAFVFYRPKAGGGELGGAGEAQSGGGELGGAGESQSGGGELGGAGESQSGSAGEPENGGDPGPYLTFLHPSVAGADVRERLREVEEEVLRRVPGVRRAKDQPFRIYDLAIDFREDEPRLDLAAAERVAAVCREMGAEAKISSIHVNAWFGRYDKLDTALRFLQDHRGVDRGEALRQVLFCGDSPNDEPMFAHFPLSCGVANVREYRQLMQRLPAYVTKRPYGHGFAELAALLLAGR